MSHPVRGRLLALVTLALLAGVAIGGGISLHRVRAELQAVRAEVAVVRLEARRPAPVPVVAPSSAPQQYDNQPMAKWVAEQRIAVQEQLIELRTRR